MTSANSPIPDKSIIVVAHPDDEVLWLSSILGQVDKIVFCFLDCAIAPELGPGRSKVIAEYPLRNAINLGIGEALSFNMSNWEKPEETQYGLRITKNSRVADRYNHNYLEIVDKLSPILGDFRYVFTHNPWGEYGHEDHVQVYRAIKTLQEKMGFDIWFSNYCSQQSAKLMMSHISGFSNDYITLPTNAEHAQTLLELYTKYKCWTWYKDYRWFKEESLMQDKALNTTGISHGHIFPINMLKTDFSDKNKAGNTFGGILRKILPDSIQ